MSIIFTVTFNVINSFIFVLTEPMYNKQADLNLKSFFYQPCFKCVKELVMVTKTVHKHEVIMCLWSREHS